MTTRASSTDWSASIRFSCPATASRNNCTCFADLVAIYELPFVDADSRRLDTACPVEHRFILLRPSAILAEESQLEERCPLVLSPSCPSAPTTR